ncbi:very short patch repair endonuclease [Amphritea sp.]|uniref:very short patch repair endonuclease n=1 Tax=Amphritea sp. TaxID=1872502 RepID=UPI0025BCA158|nr:very short patch repair endonuclease [Amphritea sp.]
MADVHSPSVRSKNMAAIKGKDTKPEIAVRKFLYANGLRYRLHRKDLAGKPDITSFKYKTVVFVNGCYWHRHKGCKFSTMPKSNTEFWVTKFQGTVARDMRNYAVLKDNGWNVIVIWECEVNNRSYEEWVATRIRANV